jgi:hypothetical protein
MTDNLTPEQKTVARLFGSLPPRPKPGEDIPPEVLSLIHDLFGKPEPADDLTFAEQVFGTRTTTENKES